MRKKNKPIVISVIIPVHNRYELFYKCLSSVLGQVISKYKLEIILVDDGSNPSVNQYIRKKFPKSEKLFKIIRLNKAKGPSVARNIGLKASMGIIIVFLDSDDIWNKNFLKNLMQRIKINNANIATTSFKTLFSKDVNLINKVKYLTVNTLRNCGLGFFYYFNKRHLPEDFFYLMRLSCTIFTRKAIDGVKFTEDYKQAEDWKFYWDAIKRNKPRISIINNNIVQIPYHKNSLTLGRSNYQKYYYKLLDELPKRLKTTLGIRIFNIYTNLGN